ncbi:MAG: hypothetical protein GWP14_07830 [Actinobacteria bacterium]|nr:hypothetical protein [Actinomycetota bacterium]
MSPPSAKAPRKQFIQAINEHSRALVQLKRSSEPIFFLSSGDFLDD